MPHRSPRRIRRKSAIIRNPITYNRPSPIQKKSQPNSRSGSLDGAQHTITRQSGRPYRYQLVPGHERRNDRSKKIALCLAGTVVIVLALIASGLYVYYFVDGKKARQKEDDDSVIISLIDAAIAKTSDENGYLEETEEPVKEIDYGLNGTTTENSWTEEGEDGEMEEEEEVTSNGKYYSEKVCIEDERRRECVVGSTAEVDTCENGGVCSQIQYHANMELGCNQFDPEVAIDRLDLTGWPSPNGTLCRRRMDNKLGVCVDGKCQLLYNGTRRLNETLIEPDWRDNCDRPNPCWTTDQLPVVPRQQCQRIPENCEDDEACAQISIMAVVWMEHRYCRMNPWRAGSYCTGLPFRLWLCRYCCGRKFPVINGLKIAEVYAMDACLQRYNVHPSSQYSGRCILTCQDILTKENMGKVVMPDGTVCLLRPNSMDRNDTGYCYKGRCFPVEASLYSDSLQSVEECVLEKEQDKLKWGQV